MADKRSETGERNEQQMMRRQAPGPFTMLERVADEMDRMFEEFGLGRGWGRVFGSPVGGRSQMTVWTPQIEVSQRENELCIRADLPGLTKDDVKVDVSEDAITIQGERRQEQQDERGGVYHTERRYGSFYRVIPLPEGAMTDQAKATFKDGVLEIRMPTPPEQVTRGRRIEITEGEPSKQPAKR